MSEPTVDGPYPASERPKKQTIKEFIGAARHLVPRNSDYGGDFSLPDGRLLQIVNHGLFRRSPLMWNGSKISVVRIIDTNNPIITPERTHYPYEEIATYSPLDPRKSTDLQARSGTVDEKFGIFIKSDGQDFSDGLSNFDVDEFIDQAIKNAPLMRMNPVTETKLQEVTNLMRQVKREDELVRRGRGRTRPEYEKDQVFSKQLQAEVTRLLRENPSAPYLIFTMPDGMPLYIRQSSDEYGTHIEIVKWLENMTMPDDLEDFDDIPEDEKTSSMSVYELTIDRDGGDHILYHETLPSNFIDPDSIDTSELVNTATAIFDRNEIIDRYIHPMRYITDRADHKEKDALLNTLRGALQLR